MFGQVWKITNKFFSQIGDLFFTLTEYVGIREVMVDQGVVEGNPLGDMFLHSGDQLTCHFFQLALRQKAGKEEN